MTLGCFEGDEILPENKGHIEIECGSERSFGLVFAGVLLIIGLYPALHEADIRIWALALSGLFLVLGLGFPQVLALPNKLWFKLGLALGAIVAPIVMMLVYFIAVVPIGLLMQLAGKDLLQQKLDKNKKSYWIIREQPVGSMKDQF